MFKRRKRHRHSWSKWEDAELMMTIFKDGRKVPYIGQKRQCTECGLREFT